METKDVDKVPQMSQIKKETPPIIYMCGTRATNIYVYSVTNSKYTKCSTSTLLISHC